MNQTFNITQFIQKVLKKATGKDFSDLSISHQSGGCVSNAATIFTRGDSFFIKWGNSAPGKRMFDAEQKGLSVLIDQSALKVPEVIDWGEVDNIYYILMENVQVVAPTAGFWENLGNGLAQLHRRANDKHGLDHDNFIGKLLQVNDFMESWHHFFVEKRLEPQVNLALERGRIDLKVAKAFHEFYKKIPELIPQLEPSLLHGDLWSGNILSSNSDGAWIIDPAIYYGSREIELAFTRLFGGFDQRFYNVYEEVFPLSPGFDGRTAIYNLYPLLVHLNMFGTAYLNGIVRTLKAISITYWASSGTTI